MKIRSCIAIASVLVVGTACSKSPAPQATPAAKSAAPAAAAPAAAKPAFDFPVVASTPARPGEYVLAPSRESIAKGADATYIYYAAKLVEKGTNESKVKSLPGEEYTVPNMFIIPLGNNQTAKPGDIVLTWWQSGSGMQRAQVIGGAAGEPEVLYLDMDYKAEAKPEKLQAGTFFALPSSSTVGNVVACLAGGDRERLQIVASAEDKFLVLGWAGKMKVVKKADCSPMPHDAGAKPGDVVQVPVFSKYQPATVTKVDSRNGRVFAKYQFAGSDKEEAFSFGEVIKGF